MLFLKRMIVFSILGLMICSCKGEGGAAPSPPGNGQHEDEGGQGNDNTLYLYADFESVLTALHPKTDKEDYVVIENPSSDQVNSSAKCGRITLTQDEWDFIYTAPLDAAFDFAEDTVVVRVKVYSEVTGKVNFKFESSVRAKDKVEKQAALGKEDLYKWKELVFYFKKSDFESKGLYFNKFNLLINADGPQHGAGKSFYFDDIRGPEPEKQTVFKRFEGNPYLTTRENTWYSLHIANVSVLSPSDATHNKWLLFARGTSRYQDGNHDDIGVFYQDKANFSPTKGWIAFAENPVLKHGSPGSYDGTVALDAVTVAVDGKIYLYYKGRKDWQSPGSYDGAVSTDGGHTFSKFSNNPLLDRGGAMSVIYHNNQYYHYLGDGRGRIALVISDDPDVIDADKLTTAITKGEEGSFDGFSVAGAKVFKVSEDNNNWYMIYQCSDNKGDFPYRFHAAYSGDLVHWTKVDNDKPLFLRGDIGQWDQGAMWTGKVIEYEGKLYIYYEGWGCEGAVKDRNYAYFKEGRSQVGVAIADVNDFLDWCKGR